MVSYGMVNRCNMCSMMSNSVVSNRCNSMMCYSMVSNWCNSMRNCMVSNTMVGSSMDHSMVRVGVVDSMRYRDGVAVFIKNGLGGVGVEEGVGVQGVEGDGGAAVDVMPELAAEEVLVKQGAVGTDESCTLRPVPAVLTHPVGLAAGLRVGVHAGGEGDGGTGELGVGGVGVAGVVHARVPDHAVLVVLWLVVGLGLVVGGSMVDRGV